MAGEIQANQNIFVQQAQSEAAELDIELDAEATTSKLSLLDSQSESTAGGALVRNQKDGKKLEERTPLLDKLNKGLAVKEIAAKEEGEGGAQKDTHQETARQFQNRNPQAQIKANALVSLRGNIKTDASPEEIFNEISKLYPEADRALVALQFLVETAATPQEKEKLKALVSDFQAANAGQIAKGTQVGTDALSAAKTVDPEQLRVLYRDVAHENRLNFVQMEELLNKYPTKSIKEVSVFLMSCAASEIKSAGAKVDSGMLHNLNSMIKLIQAALSPGKTFERSFPRLINDLKKLDIEVSPTLTPHSAALQLVKLCTDPYPSAQKAMEIPKKLGYG